MDSVKLFIENVASRSDTSVQTYLPGQIFQSVYFRNLADNLQIDKKFQSDNRLAIIDAEAYCNTVEQEIENERRKRLEEEQLKQEKEKVRLIKVNGALKALGGVIVTASGILLVPATGGSSLILPGVLLAFGNSDMIEGISETVNGEDQINPLCKIAFFNDESAYRMTEIIVLPNVPTIAYNLAIGTAAIEGTVEDIAPRVGTNESGINSINNLDDLLSNPQKLAGTSGEELYNYLLKNGYDVKPLGKGSFKGIPFEEGGGFKVNWGGDRILQYHPESLSHHGGAYFKISSGETGTIRIDLNGNLVK